MGWRLSSRARSLAAQGHGDLFESQVQRHALGPGAQTQVRGRHPTATSGRAGSTAAAHHSLGDWNRHGSRNLPTSVEIGDRWSDGELVLVPGKEGTQEKRIPIDVFFKKIVMVRDKLRVLEQKVNGNKTLSDEEKVQLQQYITGCYGSLTSFNVLFKQKEDQFAGQKT
ncbi:MAG: hypothetical protein JRD94_14960 [Deltaproteobacteria bacterium]|nr:hypothetical protein [Deltaproteobacteria bacterium]